jgi:hypothetical protein
MGRAKDIIVRPISSQDANRLCKMWHYSGKVTVNSQIHFGAFLDDKCLGVMQFGPSIDKRRMLPLVKNTRWNGFLELNRMAFSDILPKNSESRCLSVALKIIKKNYPHIKWIVTFADCTRCGDGTIYRASGFDLIGVKKNTTMLIDENGLVVADKTLNNTNNLLKRGSYKKPDNYKKLPGFQIKYIKFLDDDFRKYLTVKVLPYSTLDKIGARMYKGKKPISVGSIASDAIADQAIEGGATPTPTLHK